MNIAHTAKANEEWKLEWVKRNYEVHTWRFNLVMKALRIILNDGFLKMAILRSSEPRRSASDLIHGQQSPDGMFNEAVKLLAEFSKNTPERLSAAERDAYVRDTKILGDILYRSDDYFAVGRTETEKELDEHLEKWVKSEGVIRDNDPASDPNNLFMWLETVHPLKT